jgi:3-phosphoshikimate 1-carboxyvinyltransferase
MDVKNVKPANRIKHKILIPGDKSISHRAAILGMLSQGETRITNFLKAEDCLNTLAACQQLGAGVDWQKEELIIQGCGREGLKPPGSVIDCGNSGTGVRLLTGVLAGQPFESIITGDEQIRRRPMQRIIDPLTRMGARIESEPGGFCPLRIRGGNLKAIDYISPVASAQVKSCIILAGLFAQGKTSVSSPGSSRDHTERLMRFFDVAVASGMTPGSGPGQPQNEKVIVDGRPKLNGRKINIPSDISSAAFFMTAAALLPGTELKLKNIGVNPGRSGIIRVLEAMGAEIVMENQKQEAGEPVADLIIKGKGFLKSARIFGPMIPGLIDEIPVLAVAAAAAEGETVISDAAELRVKETDRISVLATELSSLGVAVEERPDGMLIQGGHIRGGEVDSHGDHRLAMSLAIAGLVSEQGVTIKHTQCVNTSFPGFWEILEQAAR